ncbi:MAG: oxidoreductase [Candidatus Hodarchaeales archaeon]|jgi:2,4-dienoyl-CoA reductase-like NADH-dependent reductase (Old Yellow Enzyme family)
MELETLFSPKNIGDVQIKNRIVRSATFMHIAEKYGYIGDRYLKVFEELARGGTGLIITGAVAVDPTGTGGPYQVCLYEDSHMAGHKKLVNMVHEYDNTKIAPQIQHIGRVGVHPKYPTVAPSAVPYKITGITPRELTTEEVKEYIDKFVKTGIRAYECGYDLVQLHGAHGYFLTNFLSPYTNLRSDEYGGTLEKRTNILRDIYNGIKDEVGKQFPVIIKFQSQDFIPNGITEEDGVEIAKKLSKIGFDAVEPSGGGAESILFAKGNITSKVIKKEEDENYFLPFAKKAKPFLKDCSLILVGGIRNPLAAEKILEDGFADFISLCRPLIYEPDLPNRWKSGDTSPPKCISCNSCFATMEKGPVYCVTKKNLEKNS